MSNDINADNISYCRQLHSLYAQIKIDREAVLEYCLKSTSNFIQHIDPIYCSETADPDFPNSFPPLLTERSYNPQTTSLNENGVETWPLTTQGHRFSNSLPRNTGHICIDKAYSERFHKLLVDANNTKSEFEKVFKSLKKNTVAQSKRNTDILRELEVFSSDDNYELYIRPYSFTDIKRTVGRLTTSWHLAKPSQPVSGSLEDLKVKIDFTKGNKPYELATLEAWERKHPDSKYCVRYYSPPCVASNISYIANAITEDELNGNDKTATKVWDKKLYNSSPLIILNWDEDTVLNTELDRLIVTLKEGHIQTEVKIRRGAKSVVRLDPKLNWYAFI